jgi:hypothetical protein
MVEVILRPLTPQELKTTVWLYERRVSKTGP